jgi:hypothetical protein
MPDNKRLLELALKGLQSERERIDSEIREISEQLNGRSQGRSASRVEFAGRPKPRPHGRTYSAAQKREISERMRKYWAEKRRKQPR